MHNTIQVKEVFENMAECILQVETYAVLYIQIICSFC